MSDKTAQEFSASEKGSFAEFTIRERFPKIFREVCSEQYDEFIEHTTVADGIKDGDHVGLAVLKKAVEPYNSKTLKSFFHDEPFFLVEFYFYHLLLCKRNYRNLGFDFFAFKKDASYKDKGDEYSGYLAQLFKKYEEITAAKTNKTENGSDPDDEIDNLIKKVLRFSLEANTGDLSQLREIKSEDVSVLCDETECCIGYLTHKGYDRFDIICDNSGAELFSDVYLAALCILFGMAKKVILHVKPCPFFVSDATLDDFAKLLTLLTAHDKNPELLKFLREKKIEVKTDDFWVQPYYFDSMPHTLKQHFTKSDLVIVKGDLNYRRLVKDCHWEVSDRLKDRSLLKKSNGSLIPVVAPRVLKSDLLIGIDKVFEAFARNEDPKYKTDGKWGVIQTAMSTDGNKLYKKRQKEAEKRRKKERDKQAKKRKKREKAETEKANDAEKEKSKLARLEKNHYRLFIGLFGGMVLLVIAVLSVVAFTFWQVKEMKEPLSEMLNRLDFSVVLSALTLLVGGSIILPKFLLQSEVATAVRNGLKEHADKIIQEKTDCYIKNEIKDAKNEMTKFDAHFSRMIAFFLNENHPVWSVGWCFRSLKRYGKLDEVSVGFNEYNDFIQFIQKGVLENAIQTFNKKVCKCKDMKVSCFTIFKEEADVSREPSPERPIIRAIKDIADFEYSVFFTDAQKDTGKKSVLEPICLSVGRFAQDLCIILLENGKKIEKALPGAETADKRLLDKILEISEYGQKYSKEITVRNDYKEKLFTTLTQLKSETINLTQRKEETIEQLRFFKGLPKAAKESKISKTSPAI